MLGQDTGIDVRPPKGAILTENSREIGLNCGDKIDNDKDGKIDSNDEDCESGKKTYAGCVGVSYYRCFEICDDGVDNNVNGLVDVQDVGPNTEASHLCLGINPGPYTSGCFGVEFKEFAFCVVLQ